jgi:ABC-2 type transport system permease protein
MTGAPASLELRDVHGPAALGGGAKRFWELLWLMSVTEFKRAYFGTVLGYFWSLLRPLFLFAVLYVVFTEIIDFGDTVVDYPLKLLLGLVLFGYFGDVTGAALRTLVGHGELLRSLSFPRIAIPLSLLAAEAMHLALNLLVVILFVFVSGIGPEPAWLELVPLLALLVAFTFAVSLPLSLLYVRYRDMEQIWGVLGQLLFWGTPLVYVIETVPESLQEPIALNPLAVVVNQLRHVLIDPSAPTAAEAAGGAGWLAVPIAVTAGLLALGIWLYRRQAKSIAERL